MLPNRVRIYQQSKNLLGAIFDSSLASLHRIQVRCILLLSFFLFFLFSKSWFGQFCTIPRSLWFYVEVRSWEVLFLPWFLKFGTCRRDYICCFSELFQWPVLICTVVDDNGNFEFEIFCERKFVYFDDIQFSITRFFFLFCCFKIFLRELHLSSFAQISGRISVGLIPQWLRVFLSPSNLGV